MTDETRKTARELAEHICFHRFGISIEEVEERIYRAVQEERERCLEVALHILVSHGASSVVRERMVNAIRGQGK